MCALLRTTPTQLSYMSLCSEAKQVIGLESPSVAIPRGTGKKWNKMIFFNALSLLHGATNHDVEFFKVLEKNEFCFDRNEKYIQGILRSDWYYLP